MRDNDNDNDNRDNIQRIERRRVVAKATRRLKRAQKIWELGFPYSQKHDYDPDFTPYEPHNLSLFTNVKVN